MNDQSAGRGLALGFSSGCFAATKSRYDRLAELNRRHGCAAIEFGCYHTAWLSRFDVERTIAALDLSWFTWVSIHTPRFSHRSEAHVAERLAMTGQPLVVHPERIHDFGIWRALGKQVVVENIAYSDLPGATPATLDGILDELPEAGFCLDATHAFAAGGMDLVEELARSYTERLVQLQVGCPGLPSYMPTRLPSDAELVRVSLTIADRVVPIIVERTMPGLRSRSVAEEVRSIAEVIGSAP